MKTKEIWKPIPNSKSEVSDRGRVRTNRTLLHINHSHPGGYERVEIGQDGNRKFVYIHSLVLEAFVGPRPDGLECRHLDSDPRNNRLENLQWATRKENVQDRNTKGSSPRPKMTEDEVIDIRAWYQKGVRGHGILATAKKFDKDPASIWLVVNGISYQAIGFEQ